MQESSGKEDGYEASGRRLKIFLAGRVAIEADGVRIDEERLPGRQGRLVFAYLVAEKGRPVPRGELAEELWGEAPPATWEKALTGIVSKLRALLAECGVDAGSALTSAFGCYRLQLPADTSVDIADAAEAAQEAERLVGADDLDRAKEAARRSAAIARQTFLPGEQGPWAEGKRRELADVLDRALGSLADVCLRSGDPAGAARLAQEAVTHEPFRETGYRRLMLAHRASGNRVEALRVYERCRRLFADELGAYPSPETESIYRELLATSPVAVPEEDGGVPPTSGAAPPAVPPRRRRRRRIALAAVGAVIAGAAIVVPVVSLSRRDEAGPRGVIGNSVAVIDAETSRLMGAIPVEEDPSGIAIAAGGETWVTNVNDNTVSRIDRDSGSVRDRIEVGGGPSGIDYGAGTLWVSNGLDGTVSRIDARTGDVLEEIEVGSRPAAVAFGDGAVWVACAGDGTVWKLDPQSGDVQHVYDVDASGSGITVGGGAVWLTDSLGGAVVRLDPRTEATSRVRVGSGPSAIDYRDGSVWVTNSLDGTVSRYDLGTGLVETRQVGIAPNGIAAARDAVWVTDEVAGTLIRLDPRSLEPTPSRLGGRPHGVALTEGSLRVALGAAGDAHRGGTLRLVEPAAKLDSVDPAQAYYLLSWQLVGLTSDGLVGFKRVGGVEGTKLVPDLATTVPEPTDNGRAYVFRLRDGVRFSTGRPVEPSDVRHTFERLFRSRPARPDFYEGILGGRACRERPKTCDLSHGILVDDEHRTVTFRLRRPDPEFLHKLALPFAVIVPAGTKANAQRPIPGTGPYRVQRYIPGRRLRLVRNPYFRPWSRAAQPPGYADLIELHLASTAARIAAIKSGSADASSHVPLALLDAVRASLAPQVHVVPQATTIFVLLNTKQPPFDSVLARRALAFAVDRLALVERIGGRSFAATTCQILPPNLPGYEPYCPYTVGARADGAWTAPDLARARNLVRRSGTRGMRVDVIGLRRAGIYTHATTAVIHALTALGYRVSETWFSDLGAYSRHGYRRARRVDASTTGWQQDYPAASNFIRGLFSCGTYFCDLAFTRRIEYALALQIREPRAAVRRWAQLERELVDRAVVVPLVNPKAVDVVSARVGNYQRHPVFGVLHSQLWVR